MQAEVVRATAMVIDAAGELPPKPPEHPDIIETMAISIDPHQSIHAMPSLMRGMGNVIDRLGFSVLHNTTDTPFFTSDNPVVYFDPRCSEEDMLPYTLDRVGGPVAFQFPLTPKMMLYGYSNIRQSFLELGMRHADIGDEDKVEMFNRLTCRYAYRAVFSQQSGAETLAQEYAAESPTVRVDIVQKGNGHAVVSQSVFGARAPKPKWVDNR